MSQNLDSRAKYQLGVGPYFSLKKLNNNWTGSFTVQLSTSTTRSVTGSKYCPDCDISIKHNGNQFAVGTQFNLLSNRQNKKTGLSIYALINLARNYEIYESNYNLFTENIIEARLEGNFQYLIIGLHYEERFKERWQYSFGTKIPLPIVFPNGNAHSNSILSYSTYSNELLYFGLGLNLF